MIKVRLATEADLDGVVPLLEAQMREHEIEPSPTLRNVLERVISEPQWGMVLVAEESPDGGAMAPMSLVGVSYTAAHWSVEYGGQIGWLEELFVHPDSRGRGVGGALLREGEVYARRWGWKALQLEVVSGHERVVSLYQRCGFLILDRALYSKNLIG